MSVHECSGSVGLLLCVTVRATRFDALAEMATMRVSRCRCLELIAGVQRPAREFRDAVARGRRIDLQARDTGATQKRGTEARWKQPLKQPCAVNNRHQRNEYEN